MWGTDAGSWYGSPQPPDHGHAGISQDHPGVPGALRRLPGPSQRELKDGIFGLNAAALFGVDPTAARCALPSDPLHTNIDETAERRAVGALPSAWAPNGPTTRRQMLSWLSTPGTDWRPM